MTPENHGYVRCAKCGNYRPLKECTGVSAPETGEGASVVMVLHLNGEETVQKNYFFCSDKAWCKANKAPGFHSYLDRL